MVVTKLKKKAPNQWLMNNGTQTKMRFSEECDLMQPVVRWNNREP